MPYFDIDEGKTYGFAELRFNYKVGAVEVKMFRWLRDRKEQQARNKILQQLPDKPILRLLRESIIFMENYPEPTPILDSYIKLYSRGSMSLMLWDFIEWLTIDKLEKEPGYGLSKGLSYIRNVQGEVSEGAKFLEHFVQTQEILNEYFHLVDSRLRFRPTVEREEQIIISRYIRENYIVPRLVF